jgi:predicted membrane-bound spermidine synthase
MILLLFFCSGATALVYEVVWSKYLSLMFGSTIYAQTIVLAVFMGGLALGNLLIGKRADLLKAPLSGYGRLEVIIGLYAFCFSWLYQAVDLLFVALGSRLLDHSGWLLLLKAALSVTLLLLPTVLMGGTLPLLAAWLQRQSADAGRWSARFYSTNSLGAVAGAWFAGFILVRTMGLVSTLQMTALANVLIGLTAIGISRRDLGRPVATSGQTAHSAVGQTSKLPLWVTLLVALTGGVSMGLEILASRSLTLIFGASLQAFAIVLMAFILGIGLGSGAVASPRLKRWQSENLIIVLLLVAAGVVGALVLGIEQWVEMYRYVLTGLGRTSMGYRFYQLIAAGFSLVILGVPAGLIGAILPLAIRLVAREGDDLGNRVGRLLTWNTVGAVAGVLLTGFILMPTAGVRNAFNLLAIGLCVAVAVFAWNIRRLAFVAASATLACALILSCVIGGTGWRYVLSSGIFRDRETVVNRDAMAKRKATVKLLLYEDAPDATVTVEEFPSEGGLPELGLRISGKPEASNHGDLSTQLLLGHLPMLARPGGKDVFCFGLGSGITAGAVLLHPIESLTIGENCAPVLRAARFFSPWNGGVLTNALTHIRLEDARTILKLSRQKYDAIISEPSNPWFASIGSVFSREFYSLAAARLKPGGIMVQWFHLYEMHDGIANLVFRTFQSVFPFIEIWDTNGGDIILLGSDRPWNCSLDALRQGYGREAVRRDLERIGLGTPESLLARQLASQRTAFAIAGDGPVQSDVFPVLEYAAPEAFFIGAAASRIERFDERTWQSPLAAPEKRMTLMNLGDDMLRAAFKNPSINTELRPLIASRLERAPGETLTIQTDPVTAVPCVFQMATNAFREHFSPKTSEELKQLYRARAALQREGTNWAEQVQIVRRILAAQLAPGATNSLGKIGAHFGGVAARACMAHGDLGLSEEMLNLGMKFMPDELELSYLSRVLQRRRTEQKESFQPTSSGIESAGSAAPGVGSSIQGTR